MASTSPVGRDDREDIAMSDDQRPDERVEMSLGKWQRERVRQIEAERDAALARAERADGAVLALQTDLRQICDAIERFTTETRPITEIDGREYMSLFAYGLFCDDLMVMRSRFRDHAERPYAVRDERLERAEADNARLRKALEWYGDEGNYQERHRGLNVAGVVIGYDDPEVVLDMGERARAALTAADATLPDPPKTIIRPDDDGAPDDVVIDDVTRFRLERMAAGSWWLACYRGDERLSLFLNSKKRIECVIAEDGLGCVDDREDE